jgi:hypothetical protein
MIILCSPFLQRHKVVLESEITLFLSPEKKKNTKKTLSLIIIIYPIIIYSKNNAMPANNKSDQ